MFPPESPNHPIKILAEIVWNLDFNGIQNIDRYVQDRTDLTIVYLPVFITFKYTTRNNSKVICVPTKKKKESRQWVA